MLVACVKRLEPSVSVGIKGTRGIRGARGISRDQDYIYQQQYNYYLV